MFGWVMPGRWFGVHQFLFWNTTTTTTTNNNNNNNSHQTFVHHPSVEQRKTHWAALGLQFSKEVTLDIDDLAEEPLEPQWFYFYKANRGSRAPDRFCCQGES